MLNLIRDISGVYTASSKVWVTSRFRYIRLHSPQQRYEGYSKSHQKAHKTPRIYYIMPHQQSYHGLPKPDLEDIRPHLGYIIPIEPMLFVFRSKMCFFSGFLVVVGSYNLGDNWIQFREDPEGYRRGRGITAILCGL